ncbi:hypothetical protein [Leptospira paudalimensis]|uniref:Copper resistance protein CopD n=1 Tax=Leptospira paudalimensis TaxID=2950024 RepID=A0ABT3MAC2_9LEPT|nr:hypothetical protein [Leptospira paudalimensis]MCW7505341.1 hypothetical protein [Leptospira paudalimensis]
MTAYLIFLMFHILSAMVWVGGMIFYVIVVMPVIRNQKLKEQKLTLLQLTALQFRNISYILFFILITTGFGILFSKGLLREDNLFTFFTSSIGFMFSLKIGMFGILFISSVYHDFVSGPKTFFYLESDPVQYERYRRMSGFFGRFNLFLSLFIAISGILVSRGVSFF